MKNQNFKNFKVEKGNYFTKKYFPQQLVQTAQVT